MRTLIALGLFLFASAAQANPYGSFVGSVEVVWLEDGRGMKLSKPFAYIDPLGRRWEAPAGSIINGASIPKFAWSIIGGPFEGKYRNASVVHDVACDERARDWEAVHEMFYTAMLASGVEITQAKIMYAAVYHFGPRWTPGQPIWRFGSGKSKPPAEPPPRALQEADFSRLAREIGQREATSKPVSLQEIKQFR